MKCVYYIHMCPNKPPSPPQVGVSTFLTSLVHPYHSNRSHNNCLAQRSKSYTPAEKSGPHTSLVAQATCQEDEEPSVARAHREELGFGWLPSRARAAVNRRRRHARRVQERRLGVAELQSQLHELQRKERDQSAQVVKAQSGLQCSRTNLKKLRGDHVSALHSILDDLAISRTAYFGHAYIGKYCKLLCTPAVASAITSPLLLRFSDRDRAGRRTPEFLAANKIRQRWRERFIKWGHVQQLMGASVDFVEHPHFGRCGRRANGLICWFYGNEFSFPPTPSEGVHHGHTGHRVRSSAWLLWPC